MFHICNFVGYFYITAIKAKEFVQKHTRAYGKVNIDYQQTLNHQLSSCLR
jgi:hypothetical protein